MRRFYKTKRQLQRWWDQTHLARIWQRLTANNRSPTFCLVAATRLGEAQFAQSALLGRYLQQHPLPANIQLRISYSNTEGLSSIYNRAIEEEKSDILIFLHDDVHLMDTGFFSDVQEGLRHFDVIGIAGNLRVSPYQPAWLFKGVHNQKFLIDHGHLSGSVKTGDEYDSKLTEYGPAKVACELLDGVLLAARRSALTSTGTRFDERFRFDFYDLDFCREARARGLNLGTWPLNIVHASTGCFGSNSWVDNLKIYLCKWGS